MRKLLMVLLVVGCGSVTEPPPCPKRIPVVCSFWFHIDGLAEIYAVYDAEHCPKGEDLAKMLGDGWVKVTDPDIRCH